MAIILFLLLSILVYDASAVSIMPELKQNVLRFGYGVNFRYEGMLAHLFDRFYVVTRIETPKVSDLNLSVSVWLLLQSCSTYWKGYKFQDSKHNKRYV